MEAWTVRMCVAQMQRRPALGATDLSVDPSVSRSHTHMGPWPHGAGGGQGGAAVQYCSHIVPMTVLFSNSTAHKAGPFWPTFHSFAAFWRPFASNKGQLGNLESTLLTVPCCALTSHSHEAGHTQRHTTATTTLPSTPRPIPACSPAAAQLL